MTALFSFFLRAKHWQLFLLLFLVPTILEIATAAYLPETLRSLNDLGGLVYLGLWFIATACIFVWLWAMGSFLNSIQKLGVRMNLFLRVALVFVPVYLAVFFPVVLIAEPPSQI